MTTPDYFLAGFFAWTALFYTMRILALRNRTGNRAVTIGTPLSWHWLGTNLFHVFRLLIFFVCLARLFWTDLDVAMGVVALPEVLRLAGCVMMVAGLGLVLYAHFYMAADWHSGVDQDMIRPLLTAGPYAFCRNPIFSAVFVAQTGFALALPSAFSLICLVVGVAVLLRRVTDEERHLADIHGARWALYKAQVPRWPWDRAMSGSAPSRRTA